MSDSEESFDAALLQGGSEGGVANGALESGSTPRVTFADVLLALRGACEKFERETVRVAHKRARVASAVLKIILSETFDPSAGQARSAVSTNPEVSHKIFLEAALTALGVSFPRPLSDQTVGLEMVLAPRWTDESKKRRVYFAAAVELYAQFKDAQNAAETMEDASAAPVAPVLTQELQARVSLLIASETYRQETYAWRHKQGHKAITSFQRNVANLEKNATVVHESIALLVPEPRARTRHQYMDEAIHAYQEAAAAAPAAV